MLQTVDMCLDRLDHCARLSWSCDLYDCSTTLHVIQERFVGLETRTPVLAKLEFLKHQLAPVGETANGWRCRLRVARLDKTASKGGLSRGRGKALACWCLGAFGRLLAAKPMLPPPPNAISASPPQGRWPGANERS